MSTQWTNAAGGDWTVDGNWSAEAPVAGVDAALGALSSYYTVTLTVGGAANSLTIGGSSVVLNLYTPSGSAPASLAIQGNLSNAGDLYVDSYYYATGGSTLTIGGTLSNTGYLDIGNSSLLAATTVTAAGLANTGTIYLYGDTGTDTNQAVFDITGTAPASNSGSLVLQNGAALQTRGDFNNNGSLDVYSYSSGSSSVTIGGTLFNTGTLYIQDQTTSGTTTASAADLVNSGIINLYGGTGTSAGQATLDITSGTAPAVLTGTLNLSGYALLEFASGSIASIANTASIHLSGATAFVADAGSLDSNSALSGLTRNDGTLELDSGAQIATQGGFLNDGTLQVDYTYSTGGSALTIGGTLTNTYYLYVGNANLSAATTVTAAGLANDINSLYLTGGGLYLAGGTGTNPARATLDITSGTAPSVLTGTFSLSGQALLEFAGSASIASIARGGQIILNGGTAVIADSNDTSSNSALTGLASNDGTLELEGGAAIQTQGDFLNDGTLYVDNSYNTSGSGLTVGGTLNNAGTLDIGNAYQSASVTTVSAGGLANTGGITLAGGTGTSTYQATLDITSGTAPAVLTGTLSLSGNALVEFAGSASIAGIGNNATLYLNGANAFVADAAAPTSNSALSGLASNAGTLELDGGAAIRTQGDFSNNGTLYIDYAYYASGSDLAIGGTLSNAGSLYVDGYYYNTGGGTLSIGGALINTNYLTIGSTALAAATTVSAASLVNTRTINLTGGTGSGSNQATLDITGSATDNGTIAVYGNAVLSAGSLTVVNGGSVTLTSGGTASGVSIGAGGREIVYGGGISVAPTIAGGVLELSGGVVSGGGIVFAGGGTLQIDGATMPTNPIAGFAAGDAIDLRALTFGSTTTASYDSATSTLTVSGGGVTDTLTLSGVLAGTEFAVARDGTSGTIVTEMAAAGGTQWTNSAGGDWTVAGNWAAGVLPTPSVDALLGVLSSNYTVTLTASGAANSLTIAAYNTLNLSTTSGSPSPASLAVQGNLSNGGALYLDTGYAQGGSTLTIGGTLSNTYSIQIGTGYANLSAATTVTAAGLANTGSLYLYGGTGTDTNQAVLDITSGSAPASNAGTLALESGATLQTQGDFDNSGYIYVYSYSSGRSSLTIGGTLFNTGTLDIQDQNTSGTTTASAAALVNSGIIDLYGGTGTSAGQAMLDITSGTAPSVLTGTLNLSGYALLEFASGSIASIANTASLHLTGATAFVADAGNLGRNSALTQLANNDGTVDLEGGAALAVSGDFSNTGTLYLDTTYYAAGGSTLTIGGTLVNTGTLQIGYGSNNLSAATTVSAAALTNTGYIYLYGGTGTTAAQATLDITSATAPSVLTGTLNLSGDALLEFAGSASIASITSNAVLLLNGASAFVADASAPGSNSALTGLKTNDGTLYLASGAQIDIQGDFLNNNYLDVDYGYASAIASTLTIGGTLSNAGYLYIGNGSQTPSGSTVSAGALDNTGTIILNGGTNTAPATLDIISGTAPSVLTGTLNLSGHALLEFASGSIANIGKSASLTLNGVNAFVADSGATASNSALTGLASNAGTVDLEGGAAVAVAGDLSNAGTLDLDTGYYAGGGSTLTIAGTLSNTGSLQIGDGYNTLSATTTVSATALTSTGYIYLYGGTGTNTYQATLDVTAGTAPSMLAGYLDLSGHALIEFAGSASITSIARNAQIILTGGSAFIANSSDPTSNSALTGLASNAGYLYLENGETLQTQSDFSNTSNLELYDNSTSGVSSLTIGGTLSNTSTITIDNQTTSGTTTVSAQDLVNTGTINLTGGTGTSTAQARLDITPATAPAVLTGSFSLSGDALVDFAGGSIAGIANTATLHLSGANAFIADANNTSSNSALTGLASNAGTLELDSGAQLAIQGDFANRGSLQVDYYYYYAGGSNLSVGGTLSNTGYLYLGTTYQTTSATTISAADLANAGSIYLYGGSGTAGQQTTLDIAGAATDTGTLYLYGDAVVSAGSLTVASGGALDLYSGGTAGATTVGSGGHEYVYSGGISTNTTIAGGTLELAGGSVTAATIDFTQRGGILQIDGALPSNTIVGFRQSDIIDLHGVAFDSTGTGSIDAGNALTVSAGGSTYTLQLDPLHNYANATVSVANDGSGHTNVAIATPPIFVLSAQTLPITGGATDDNVNVLSGGTLVVSGGTATDTINSGSEILSGGLDLDGIVAGGGTMLVAAGGIASNTTVSPLGQLTVLNAGVVSDPTIAGGILDLAAGAVANGTIAFSGTGGTIEIDGAMPTNPIAGFAPGDTIDLRALAWSSTNSVSFDSLTNMLTVSNGGTIDTLTLTGVAAGTKFAVASDGQGGTTVGTIQNNGTLTGTYLNGIVLSNPTAQNPTILTTGSYVTNQTTAHNGDAVYGTNAAAWTLSNYGTINATGTPSDGVSLRAGGVVTNGQSGATGGLIEGNNNGLTIYGSGGTVTNFGTVAGTGTNGTGVNLAGGGSVINGASGSSVGTIAGGSQGIGIFNGTGTVVNYGTIAATDTGSAGIVNGSGIFLTAGGTIANLGTVSAAGNHAFAISIGAGGGYIVNGQAGSTLGLITAYDLGIFAGGPISGGPVGLPSTIVNYGTIRSTQTGTAVGSGFSGFGIQLSSAGTIDNFGTILSSQTNGGAAILLQAGGVLTNYAGGLIAAPTQAITVANTAATIVNSGTISSLGTNASAINFGAGGGTVLNQQGGLITAYHNGIGFFPGTAANPGILTVVNHGTILSTQTGPAAGTGLNGFAINIGVTSTATIDNFGRIAGSQTAGGGGIVIASGEVTNEVGGIVDGQGGNAITNPVNGGGAVTVINFGTIENATGSTNSTVYISHGGAVINQANALIINQNRAAINFGNNSGTEASFGNLSNAGTVISNAVTGGGGAVYFSFGGVVTNQSTGLIAANRNGITIDRAAGTVVNFGTIAHVGSGTGGQAIYLGAGGTVTNYGLISGSHPGSPASGGTGGYPGAIEAHNQPVTVVNLGTIANPNNSNGVNLLDGGLLINGSTSAALASITAPHTGVYTGGTSGVPTPGATGTIINYGTIQNASTTGQAVRLVSGGTVTNRGLISSLRTGISFGGTIAGTVDNFGTVLSTPPASSTAGAGIYMQAGGLITNELGATITAGRNGITFNDTAGTTVSFGTVINSGTIASTGTTAGIGVYFGQGGVLTNGSAGLITAAYSVGVAVRNSTGGAASTVVNSGTIESFGTHSGVNVSLNTAALVQNHGLIAGGVAGVSIGSSFATSGTVTVVNDGTITGPNGINVSSLDSGNNTVVNSGTIQGTDATAGVGVYFGNGGSLSNSGPITGYVNGAAVLGSYGLVNNLGTIAGTGTSGLGVYLAAGGSVVNGPGGGLIGGGFAGVKLQTGGAVLNGVTATITGGRYGIWAETAAASVSNYGTIAGTGPSGDGVFLNNGGTVANASGALITGVDDGVCIAGSAGTVVNHGIITGTGSAALGVMLGTGSSVTNAAAALIVGGGDAVVIDGTSGGSVANYGTISGGYDGIVLKAAGSSVVNYGTVTGAASSGVYLYSGDSATNASTGLIEGGYAGVLATHSAGTVTNFGTIIGTGSNGVGVNLMVTGSTLTNAGAIIGVGGYAARFTGANNRLIIDPGASFSGGVYGGGGGSDVLELAAGSVAATGTILAGGYSGFDQFTIDPLARWVLSGTDTIASGSTLSNAGTLEIVAGLTVGDSLLDTGVIDIGAGATLALANGAGGTGSIDFAGPGGVLEIDGTTMPAPTITISGFTPGETIDLRGVSGGATLDATHLLTVFEGGSSFALQLDQAQSFGGFAVVGDGSGGTDVFALAQVVVSAGVPFVVSAGQTLIGVSVESGGTLEVASGASVFGTQISSGGSEIVDSGGIDSGTLVFSGGSQTVAFGGTALGTVLDGVAVQTVSGSAGGTTVSSGDSQIVASGGVASGTTILSGGSETVFSGGLTIDTVIAGGNLVLSAGAATGGSIDFVGSGGVLEIDSNAMPATAISGFAQGGSIDLRGLPFDAGNSVTFNAGMLTVVSGSITDTLTLSGVPSGTVFGLASDANGDTLVQEVGRPPASLFDFVFTYNDGKDYYFGTVADDGTYGYFKGEQITTLPGVNLAGHYDIFEEEGLLPATPLAAGTVFILDYSHGGPGVASPTPLGFPAPATTLGLGHETGTVLGTDGQSPSFGPTTTAFDTELSFPTADLFGFVFSYADGAAFYSGTVAVTTGTTPAIPASAGILGTYSVFAEGVTTRAAGTVVVDRFTAGDASFSPDSGGAIDGTGGLGSETDSITVNGQTASFNNQQEPALTLSVPTVPTPPPPGTTQLITAELTQIYSEVLGRGPSSTELQTDSSELANGTSLSSIRTALAQTTEAQGDVDGLYHQVFDRAATSAELATQTGALAGGSSLQTVQLILAQSPEVQTDLRTSYSEVLGRAIGGSELTADMVQIGNESATAVVDPDGRSGVAGVRDILAQSPEAQNDLTQLFQGIVGSAPTAAQLLGMEVQLGKPGFSLLQTLQPALISNGAAGTGATIAAGAGNATLTAASGTPTLFDFTNLGFGNDTIAGFDPTRDTIELPHALVANIATLLQQDTTATAGGALITLNSSQSIVLNAIAPTSLGQTNFLLV